MILRFPNLQRRYWKLIPSYAQSMVAGYRERGLFKEIESYCMFIGYPRSGHSLVGSLLDAHPDVVIAHELHVLGFLQARFSRSQVFALIMNNSRQIAAKGRTETGYDYVVPDSWQGRARRLRVIGDKRAGRSGARLQRHPELLDRLRKTVGVPVQYVHVVRNPYDNISTISKRQKLSMEQARDLYFLLCDSVMYVKRRAPAGTVLDLRHENLIADPKATLKELCAFIDVDPTDEFLDGCAGIVFDSPHRSRLESQWSPGLREDVRQRMAAYPYLDGYVWDQ